MSLPDLFKAVAEVLDGDLSIEREARAALLEARPPDPYNGPTQPLDQSLVQVLSAPDAHPVCQMLLEMPLNWVPPQTSSDPAYVAHSHTKVHVELLGPEGLVRSDGMRLGLYGIGPHIEYGIRTHPAEEVFVMIAGRVLWKRGDAPYLPHGPGERSYHPSMLPHATKTEGGAFMSVYVWSGDISTSDYRYAGIPADWSGAAVRNS